MNNLREYLAEQVEVNIYDYYPSNERHIRKLLEELSGDRRAIFIKSCKGKGLYVRIDHASRKEIDKYYRSLKSQTKRIVNHRLRPLKEYIDDENKERFFGRFEGFEDD